VCGMFGCASSDTVAVRDIANTQLHKIAAAQLAVERHIEQREFALVSGDLEANPNCPNIPEFERCFLPGQLTFVPGIAAATYNGGWQHLELLRFEGSSKGEINRLESHDQHRFRSAIQHVRTGSLIFLFALMAYGRHGHCMSVINLK